MYDNNTHSEFDGFERNGIVIDWMPRGDVAAIVFTYIKDPLYLVPRKLLLSDMRNTQHLSNSQRNKLNKTFIVGDNVEFNLSPNGQMTSIEKCTKVRELCLSPDGKNVLYDIGVVSNEEIPRLYTTSFGYLKADPQLLKSVYPNVAFKCAVQLDLDYGLHKTSCEFDLETFRPKLFCSLHSFMSVDLGFEYVFNAPWNVEVSGERKLNRYSEWKDEFVGYVTNQISENGTGRKTHRNVACVAISENEVFSAVYSRRIMVARRKFEKNDFVPGMMLAVDLYYCPVNRCHIVFDYMLSERILPSRNLNGIYQFFVELKYLGKQEGYVTEVFGKVSDPEGWFAKVKLEPEQTKAAWIEHNPDYDSPYERFIIFSVPNAEKPPQEPSVSNICGWVIDKIENIKFEQDDDDAMSMISSMTRNANQLPDESIEAFKSIITLLAGDSKNHELLKKNGLYSPIMNAYKSIPK